MTESTLSNGLTLEARIGSMVDPVKARLLPSTGPTYADMLESRRRWIAGETVTPTGLIVGTVALSASMQTELREGLGQFMYTRLETDLSNRSKRTSAMLDECADSIRLVHCLVRRLGMLDARRRGMASPQTDLWFTNGGRTTPKSTTDWWHVDSRNLVHTAFRYVLAAVGEDTELNLNELCRAEVDPVEGELHEALNPSPLGRSLPDGLAALMMFELHTPHRGPEADGESRLFSSLDVVEAGTNTSVYA